MIIRSILKIAVLVLIVERQMKQGPTPDPFLKMYLHLLKFEILIMESRLHFVNNYPVHISSFSPPKPCWLSA